MNRVATIVLNWNGIDDTLSCLDSLREQSYSNQQIVVIDNGSVDNSADILKSYIATHSDNIEVIYNKHNLGFAGGVNTGIRWALENNFDAIALFNNDARADHKWLEKLMAALSSNEDAGIATGLLLHYDGKTIDSSGDWYSSWGLPFPRNRNDQAQNAPPDGLVFGASGGATVYKAAIFSEIGLFDEDFFAYYEDADISFRSQLAGWKTVYTSTAIAYHKQGASSEKIPGLTVLQTFKNLPWLFIKNVPRKLIISIGIRFMLAYILMFGNAIKNGSGKYALRGLIYSLKLFPKKIRERRLIQKSKKVSSEYIHDLLWKDLPPDQSGIRKLRNFFLHR